MRGSTRAGLKVPRPLESGKGGTSARFAASRNRARRAPSEAHEANRVWINFCKFDARKGKCSSREFALATQSSLPKAFARAPFVSLEGA